MPIDANERARLIANRMMSRAGLITELTSGEGNRRDLNQCCGYPAEISREDYQEMYDRGGPAGRVVDLWPDESWQIYPEVYEVEDNDKETEFEKAWKDLCKKRLIYHYLHRVDILSGIGCYGILLLGLNDGKELLEPAVGVPVDGLLESVKSAGKAKLMYLRAYGQHLVEIAKFEEDRKNPRYGMPVLYTIQLNDPKASNSNTGGAGYNISSVTVHWTRVIHVCDNRQASEVFGTPRMQPVWNNLLNLRRTYGGSTEMLWQGGFPGLSVEMDPRILEATGGIAMSPEEKAEFEQQIQSYTAGLNRYLLMQGFTVKSLTPNVADPTAHVDINLQACAMRLSIPLRKLLGSEEGKLAAGQDSDTWDNRVRNRQQKYLEPMLLMPLVERLMMLGCLPIIERPLVDWPDISSPSDKDKADIGLKWTQAIAAYVSSGAQAFMPPLEYFVTVWKMDKEEAQTMLDNAAEYAKETVGADIETSQQYLDAGLDRAGNPLPPEPQPGDAGGAGGMPGAKGKAIPKGKGKPGAPTPKIKGGNGKPKRPAGPPRV